MKAENDNGAASGKVKDIVANIERVIIGKHEVVVQAVSALLAGGHVLVEDVPGVGKTMLGKAMAKSIGGQFKRIQFTADLLPSDVTGVNMYHQRTGGFRFRRGPLFANVLLGDEINRATPRTQSSLLEAMEENQATVDGEAHVVERPFFVIATQNPIELEGTYPLPFAQMDRFMVRLRLGYLAPADERRMVQSRIEACPLAELPCAARCEELLELQQTTRRVRVAENVLDYAVSIVHRTRATDAIEYGASPRATLDLVRYAQATALICGRSYTLPDDVKQAAPAVLAHRLIVKRAARRATPSTAAVVADMLTTVEAPV